VTPERALASIPATEPAVDPIGLHVVAPSIRATSTARRFFLASEFLLLFLGLPIALYFHLSTGLPPLPILWVVATWCLAILLRDPTFDRRQLWNTGPLRQQLPQIFGLFAAGAAIMTVLVRQYAPDLFLILLRTHPGVWALVMVGYPLFSVYPQALIYRAFFFHRYRPLLESFDPLVRSWIMIVVSAATFALMHILFHNWIAVALTFPGGILFALRYCNTRSLAVSSLEHALYGCFLFTVGLGQYFYVRVV
jgi:membrane protease YdiL (CAAX protease family)